MLTESQDREKDALESSYHELKDSIFHDQERIREVAEIIGWIRGLASFEDNIPYKVDDYIKTLDQVIHDYHEVIHEKEQKLEPMQSKIKAFEALAVSQDSNLL